MNGPLECGFTYSNGFTYPNLMNRTKTLEGPQVSFLDLKMPISELKLCMFKVPLEWWFTWLRTISIKKTSFLGGGEVKMIYRHQTLNVHQMTHNKPIFIVKIRLCHTRKKYNIVTTFWKNLNLGAQVSFLGLKCKFFLSKIWSCSKVPLSNPLN